MRTSPSIVVANLVKRFGDIDAVNDVTFEIQPGEIVGFVGPNGAGKTTTISMMMGFIAPTRGSVTIHGQAITPQTAHQARKRIGYVAGDMVLPANLTAKQYLDFTSAVQGRVSEQFDRLVRELSPVLDRRIKNLSRGNKQKVALVAALQHRPDILILDEPTSGLDPLMQDIFLKTIRDEAARGATILMSSHILSEVSDVCNRIIFMKTGKLIMNRSIDGITAQLGKRLLITSSDAKKIRTQVPKHATVIHSDATSLEIGFEKTTLPEMLRWVSTKNVSDVSIHDKNLDDIFHDLYEPSRKGRGRS